MNKKSIVLALCLGILFGTVQNAWAVTLQTGTSFTEYQFMSFDELKELSAVNRGDNPYLENKLYSVLNKVVVKQSPQRPSFQFNLKKDKNFVRVSHWNVARGIKMDTIEQMFSDTEAFLQEEADHKRYEPGSEKYEQLKDELEVLKSSDILVLNEVDFGMSRTDYQNIADRASNLVNGGYAFVPEFLELNPNYINDPNVNPSQYKGLHGNAIISKFPIKSVGKINLPVCYDWFDDEKKRVTLLERLRRKTAHVVMNEQVETELRRGNRAALVAEIDLPHKENVTVVSTHFENRGTPACRVKQIEHLLSEIKNIKTPVVFSGDLNSFEYDASPSSVSKIVAAKLSDPEFIIRTVGSAFNPYSLAINPSLIAVELMRKYRDPTVKNVPVISRNRARKLFKKIRGFEFDDHNKFDFSNDQEWSYKRAGVLSTSNERSFKGFVPTFKVNRSYKIVRFKIDWFFVKPLIDNGKKTFFPAFGRTLKNLNFSPKGGLVSDHNPITLDLMI